MLVSFYSGVKLCKKGRQSSNQIQNKFLCGRQWEFCETIMGYTNRYTTFKLIC